MRHCSNQAMPAKLRHSDHPTLEEKHILLYCLARLLTSAWGSLETLRVLGVSVSIILPGLGMAGGSVSSIVTLTRGRAKGLEGLTWLIAVSNSIASEGPIQSSLNDTLGYPQAHLVGRCSADVSAQL